MSFGQGSIGFTRKETASAAGISAVNNGIYLDAGIAQLGEPGDGDGASEFTEDRFIYFGTTRKLWLVDDYDSFDGYGTIYFSGSTMKIEYNDNQRISFFTSRGVEIAFRSADSTDPGLDVFAVRGKLMAYPTVVGAGQWQLGKAVNVGACTYSADDTKYISVTVDGVSYKLRLCNVNCE